MFNNEATILRFSKPRNVHGKFSEVTTFNIQVLIFSDDIENKTELWQ